MVSKSQRAGCWLMPVTLPHQPLLLPFRPSLPPTAVGVGGLSPFQGLRWGWAAQTLHRLCVALPWGHFWEADPAGRRKASALGAGCSRQRPAGGTPVHGSLLLFKQNWDGGAVCDSGPVGTSCHRPTGYPLLPGASFPSILLWLTFSYVFPHHMN